MQHRNVVLGKSQYICVDQEDPDEPVSELDLRSKHLPAAEVARGSCTRRADIDGLRAVAVCAVVLFHLRPQWLPGGFTGVDVFFVISGYVVTASVLATQRESVTDYLVSFYARRVKRLVPALATVVVLTTIGTSAIVPAWLKEEQRRYYETALHSLLGASNIYLARNFDYFDLHLQRHSEFNPFLHTWSLAVEEQFYAVQPLLLLALHGSSLVVSCHTTRSARQAGFAQVALTLASMALAHWCAHLAPDKAYYLLFTRFWELQTGVALFHVRESTTSQKTMGRFSVRVVELMTIALFGVAMGWSPPPEYIPWPWVAVPTMGTLGVLAAGDSEHSMLGSILSLHPFVYIGSISYTFYLFHHPVFALTRWLGHLDHTSWAGGALIASILLAALTSHFLEQPLMRWKPEYQLRAFVLPAMMLGSAALLILAVSGVSPFFGKLYGPTYHQQKCPADHGAPKNYGNIGCRCQIAQKTYHTPPGATELEVGMPPCFDMCAPIWSTLGMDIHRCDGHTHPSNVASCLTPQRGTSREQKALFFLGDSHAEALAPGMAKAVAGILAYAGFYKPGGFIDDGGYFSDNKTVKHNAEVTRMLDKNVRAGDVIVVTCNSVYFYPDDHSGRRERYVKYMEQLERHITGPRGAHILLLNDVPVLPDAGYFCLPTRWKPEGNWDCPAQPVQDMVDLQATLVNEWTRLAQRERVHFMDIRRLLCDNSSCSIFIPGTEAPYTADGGHMNGDGANYMWPFLCSFMKDLGIFDAV